MSGGNSIEAPRGSPEEPAEVNAKTAALPYATTLDAGPEQITEAPAEPPAELPGKNVPYSDGMKAIKPPETEHELIGHPMYLPLPSRVINRDTGSSEDPFSIMSEVEQHERELPGYPSEPHAPMPFIHPGTLHVGRGSPGWQLYHAHQRAKNDKRLPPVPDGP